MSMTADQAEQRFREILSRAPLQPQSVFVRYGVVCIEFTDSMESMLHCFLLAKALRCSGMDDVRVEQFTADAGQWRVVGMY